MSNKDNPVFSHDWSESQRNYWNAWADMCQKSMNNANATSGSNNPDTAWADGLDQWWKAVSSMAPGEGQQSYERMVDQGKAFMSMGEDMMTFLNGLNADNKSTNDWQNQLQARFDEIKSSFSSSPMDFTQGLGGLGAFSNMPMDNWQRTMSTSSMFPGDFLKGMKSANWDSPHDQLHEHVNRFLSVPGVGYSRESQDQFSKMATLTMEYQRVNQEYNQAHSQVASASLDKLQQKIISYAEQGKEINTLREVYDLWVDCSEEAYSDFVRSPEYTDLYGRMVNSLMAVKQQGRVITEENMAAMGMPTQTDFDTLAKRQQELRRQLLAVKKTTDSTATDDLAAEVAALRKELAAMKKTSTSSSPELAKKKTATKKKVAAKKKAVSKKKAVAKKKGE